MVTDNNYPPYVFAGKDGNIQGILVDQWRLWQKKTGIQVDIIGLDWEDALARMRRGEFDVIDTAFKTEERLRWLDFGTPYTRIEVPAFFKNQISGITDVTSLRGFVVAVKEGDAAIDLLRKHGVEKLVFYKGYEEIIQAAKDHKVNVFVVDKPPALYFLYKYGIERQFHVSSPFSVGEFHRAVTKGNAPLLQQVESGFALISAEELKDIEKKWYGAPLLSSSSMGYLLVGTGLLWVLLVSLFFGNRTLREAVRKRTRELETSREEARESESRYRGIIENLEDTFYRTDTRGNLVYISPSGIRLLGYGSQEEVLGRSNESFWYHPEKRLEMLAVLQRDGVVREYEVILVGKDGEPLHVSTTSSYYRDKEGQILGIQGIFRDITERKRAEYELVKTKDLLLQTSRMARVGGWEVHLDTGETNFSEITREIIDVDGGFLPTRENVLEFCPPGPHRDRLMAAAEEAVGKGQQFDIEFQVTTAAQQKRWVRCIGRAGFRDGVCVRLFGTLQDIDSRKKTEEALVESEERLRLLVKNSFDALVIIDSDGRQRYVSPGAERITGFSVEHLQGRRLEEIIHPDDRSAIVAAWKEAVAHPEKTFIVQYRHIHRTRGWVHSEAIAQSFLADPSIQGVIASVRDITAHKTAEEELQLARHRLRLFLDASSDLYFLKDTALRYLLVNKANARFFGLAEEEILNRTDADLMEAQAAKQCAASDQRAMEMRRTVVSIEEVAGRVYETQKLPVLIGEEVCGVAGIVRDITDAQKDAEEKAKLQQQLTQAQKMESVGRLAGGVAHDFNNMLSVILGHTELILKTTSPDQPHFANLEEISRAAGRSAALTRQLLAFARKQTVAPRVLDLNETVEGMLKMLRRLIGEGIDLIWLPGRGLGRAKIDPIQVDQILANLCINARDAITDTGKVVIKTANAAFDQVYCTRHPDHQPGEYIMLSVSDDGSGMTDEILEHLFEPFFTTKEMGLGTGLGLATVYGIVRQNEGFLTVESKPGMGTTFSMYLPRHERQEEWGVAEDRVETVSRGHETILLVEDEPMILDVTQSMLCAHGYKVLPAPTPGEALRLAQEHGADISLLMTDVIMPEMNGHQLAQKIRAQRPGIRRLFMSGYTADVIAQHGVLPEGVNFIQKPFTMGDLALKIREVLGEKSDI